MICRVRRPALLTELNKETSQRTEWSRRTLMRVVAPLATMTIKKDKALRNGVGRIDCVSGAQVKERLELND